MPQLEIEQGDVTLVVSTQGPRKGPTVLFLHDGGDSKSVWSPIFSRLRPKHWQLVAPDLRGHGESGRAVEYQFDDFLADGYEIIRRLKGRPLVVVGDGVGGQMALMLAQRHPLLIDGLVLLNAPTRLSQALAKRESQKILSSLTSAAKATPTIDPRFASDQLLEDILSDPERLAQAARSVSVPTLFLYSSDSDAVSSDDVAAVQKDIPHVELGVIEASQCVATDNPQALADYISDFLPTLIPEIIH